MVLCSATMTIIVEKLERHISVYYLYLYMNVYVPDYLPFVCMIVGSILTRRLVA